MANLVIKELDAAALIILAPPNHVTPDQRRGAEEIFLNFRKTTMPYQLCREILETSTMDFVLYESVRLIKTALVKEWKLLPNEDINTLKQYLFHYIVNKPTIAPFVREQILQVIAIMTKRIHIDEVGKDCGFMLDQIESLVINGDSQRQLLGCGMLSALLQEFATTNKTSDIGLVWKVHCRAKLEFESYDLKRIFKFCVSALSELTKDDIVPERLPLVKHLITIVEAILVWGFLSGSNLSRRLHCLLESICESDNHASLRLDRSWADVILDPMVMQLFFTLYWKTRTNLQIAHHARNCLVQLASLNGPVIDGKSSQYLNEYLSRYIKLISNIEMIDQEAIGMAQIIRYILTFFGHAINSAGAEFPRSLIDQMTRLTFIFAEGATQEESLYAEDCLYMDAFELMLDNWLTALADDQWFPAQLIEQSTAQIFNLYLKCRLSPPDGNRQINDKELETEVVDTEQHDRKKYKKQLQIIGVIGRKVPGHSLMVLTQLLENRTIKLRHELSQVTADPKSNFNGPPINIRNLYEDIHWLVLLSGHVLCMESDGELSLIPSEIMRHSMQQKEHGKVDINMSLQMFASPHLNLSEISTNEEYFDHVIRLSAAVLRLCEIEKMAINANMAYILSPELSGTIVWFLQRWSLNYLLPNEDDYREISLTFVQAFGGESAGAQWAVNFLLEKVQCNIMTFMGEEDLIKDVIEFLMALVKSKPHFTDRTLCVLKSDRLGSLIDLVLKNHIQLPQVAKRGLMCAIVEIGAALKNENEKEQYWTQTLQFVQDKLNRILSTNDFTRSVHQEDVKLQILDALDCFIGAAQGINITTAPCVFRYFKPVLFQLANLMSQCHNYQQIVQLILELLYECSQGMLHYVNEPESIDIYQSCIHTIEAYARYNVNRVTVDVTEEENTFQDILILMKLFCELLAKDTIFGLNNEDPGVRPADVFVMGLNTIMPMMTIELLKFPSLCYQYFEMISLVCDIRPQKVCELRPDLLQQLMGSVELGLVSFGNLITEKCCHIIKAMAIHIQNESAEGQPSNQLMAPFMNLLMNLILTRQINIVSNTSAALYSLIRCYHEQYQKLVENFLAAQPDSAVAEKLASAFNELTPNMKLNFSRNERIKFRDNFDKFVVTVLESTVVK